MSEYLGIKVIFNGEPKVSFSKRLDSPRPHSAVWRVLLTLLTIFVLAGCDSAPNEFVNISSENSRTIVGKVFAGVPIEGAEVTVVGPDGNVYAQTVSNRSGNFLLQSPDLPNFRIEARFGDGLVLAREERNFTGGFMVVNVPTTLLSAALADAPDGSVEEAKSRVLAQAGILEPEVFSLMEESFSQSFSHAAFFAEAAKAGGVQAYIQQFRSDAKVPGAPFRLRRDRLHFDDSGLDPEIREILATLRADKKLELALSSSLSRGLDFYIGKRQALLAYQESSLNRTVLAAEASTGSALGEFAGSAAENLLEYVGVSAHSKFVDNNNALDKAFSWVGVALGWRTADTDTLEAIQAQLEQVQTDVDNIAYETEDSDFQMNSAPLDAAAQVFTDFIADEIDAVNAINESSSSSDFFNNEPPTSNSPALPTGANTFLAAAQDQGNYTTFKNNLRLIQQGMTGRGPDTSDPVVPNEQSAVDPTGSSSSTATPYNVMLNGSNLLVRENYGIPMGLDVGQISFTGYSPVRSSYLLDVGLQVFNKYGTYQILGMAAMSEVAHASDTPATSITLLLDDLDHAMASILSQRAQLPIYPMSDNYFIDTEYGIMWYLPVQAEMSYADANNFALNFDDGQFDNWRLPAYQEALALQKRGTYARARAVDDIDYSETIDGLEYLGFDVDGVGDDGDIWCSNWYYSNDGYVKSTEGLEARLNHKTDTSYYYGSNVSVERPFFMVRSLETPVMNMVLPENSISEIPGQWPSEMMYVPSGDEIGQEGSFYYFNDFEGFDGYINYLKATFQTTFGSHRIVMGTSEHNDTFSTDYVRSYTVDRPDADDVFAWFASSNNSIARISNFPHDYQSLYYNENAAINITASGLAVDENGVFPTVSASVLENDKPLTINPSHNYQIAPRNQALNLTGGSSTDTVTFQFTLTDYLANGGKGVVATTANWVYENDDGSGQVPGISFSTSQIGELKIDKSAVPPALSSVVLRIKAEAGSFNDVVDQTKIRLNLK